MLVGRDGIYDLGASTDGTSYYVSDSALLSISPEGLVTAQSLGLAHVIVITGVSQAEVPVLVQAPHIGPTGIGSEGGTVEGPDGSQVSLGPGALADDTLVSIEPIVEVGLPINVPDYYAFAGAFTTNQNINDVLVLIIFTMFGFGMRLIGLNPAAFLIGFILTPMLEQNLDQAVAIVGDDYAKFFTTPFAWIFTALAAISVYSTFRQKKKSAMKMERVATVAGNADMTDSMTP